MLFDQDGILQKVEVKVNSVGKKFIMNNEKIENRKNILLLGDILADVNMVSNL